MAGKPQKIAENARKAETDYASATFILEQAHDELTALYSKAEQLSLQYNHQTLQLDQQREHISQMEAERQQEQNEIALLRSEIQHHQTNIGRIRQELQDQQNRSGGIAGQIESERQKIADNTHALAAANENLTAVQQEAKSLAEQNGEAGQQLVSIRAQQAAFAVAECFRDRTDCVYGGVHGGSSLPQTDAGGGYDCRQNPEGADRGAAAYL